MNQPALAQSVARFEDDLAKLEENGEDEKALVVSAEAIRKWPTVTFFHIYRARILGNLKRYNEALKCCDKAVALVPKSFECQDARAEIYYSMGKTAEAIAACDRAILLNKDDVGGRRLRAKLNRNIGNYDKAVEDMTYVLVAEKGKRIGDPSRSRDLEMRGKCYMESKKYQLAVDDFTTLIKVRMGYGEAYRLRAKAYEAMGNKEQAKRDMYKAAATGDDWAPPGFIGK